MSRFAYLFERFPCPLQTFVAQEVAAIQSLGLNPWIVSLHRPQAECPQVCYLPDHLMVRDLAERAWARGELPRKVGQALARHRNDPDARRLFEAIWLQPRLHERGVQHLHAHFAGVAARTAWWLHELFGFSYSFTGHANDLFCADSARLVQAARFVVTESDYARAWLQARYSDSNRKIFRIYNGLRMSDYPARQACSAGPLRILSVGRLIEKKGFPVLIEACQRLCQQGLSIQCDLVGGGPLEASLRLQIEEAGLSGQVHLLGELSHQRVRELFRECGLFVLASVPDSQGGQDNFPTVIMEAMASGVPVVSTRLAGIPEMIQDGIQGLLVAPGDVDALAAALSQLIKNPDQAGRMGLAGRERASSLFQVEDSARALEKLLARQSQPVALNRVASRFKRGVDRVRRGLHDQSLLEQKWMRDSQGLFDYYLREYRGIRVRPGSSVCDLGAGPGYVMWFLRELSQCRVWGMEAKVREDYVALWREFGLQVEIKAVVSGKPVAYPGKFDIILATGICFNRNSRSKLDTWNRQQYLDFLKDAWDHLEPGGQIYLRFNERPTGAELDLLCQLGEAEGRASFRFRELDSKWP